MVSYWQPFLYLAPMVLVKGTPSRFVWKMFFLQGAEALMGWDLHKNLKAQAVENLPDS